MVVKGEEMYEQSKTVHKQFPGGPMVRTLLFHCWGPGFNQIPHWGTSPKLHDGVAKKKKKRIWYISLKGFPCSSASKESACNAGNPNWIPGLGQSAGERIGYPLQYSWASQVVQLVKNSPAMREIWVRSLGWEDPLEKGTATHANILACKVPCTEELAGYSPWGCKELDTTE